MHVAPGVGLATGRRRISACQGRSKLTPGAGRKLTPSTPRHRPSGDGDCSDVSARPHRNRPVIDALCATTVRHRCLTACAYHLCRRDHEPHDRRRRRRLQRCGRVRRSARPALGGSSRRRLRPPVAWTRALAARGQLDLLVADLVPEVVAVGTILDGPPARRLAGRSKRLDLRVVGSRGYGVTRAALTRGVSGRVMRDARCPVIAVPRGAEASVGELFGAPATP